MTRKFCLVMLLLLSCVVAPQRAFSRAGITDEYVRLYGWEAIEGALLDMGIAKHSHELFDRNSIEAGEGFLGYHGSQQEYRIYQDIIRCVFEELLEVPIRKDFHFFRIPGESYYTLPSSETLSSSYQSRNCVCFNFTLYGNHYDQSNCSYYYFYTNSSSSKVDYEEVMRTFFQTLGIDQRHIIELFSLGRSYLSRQMGVLYSLHDAYYLRCPEKIGNNYAIYRDWTNRVADVVLHGGPPLATEFGVLLVNNHYALNPYSTLSIIRHDLVDPLLCEQYLFHLRQAVSFLSFDEEKARRYKKRVINMWRHGLHAKI